MAEIFLVTPDLVRQVRAIELGVWAKRLAQLHPYGSDVMDEVCSCRSRPETLSRMRAEREERRLQELTRLASAATATLDEGLGA